MKRIFGAAVAAVMSMTAWSAEPTAVEDYFAGYLGGDATPYVSKQKLRAADVEAAAKEVWEAWRRANRTFDEEKLPPLGALSADAAWKWHIPDSLEPQAVMPFRYGSKGVSQPASGYPFFLYLHGSGPKEHEWATGTKLALSFDDSPSVYFVPQIPNEGRYYRWWQRSKQHVWGRLLRQVLASGDIDADRVYMFGISEGGYGSQRLASFYADYLAGAGPMAGGEPLRNAPAENLRNTAFSLRTGALDDGFYREKLTRYTARALDSLQRTAPDAWTHNVELIPGCGHSIDYSPTTPWLAQHKRNPYPRRVVWENFEMDSTYRDGFYNLYVDRRSNTDFTARTLYEMSIDGNDISLNMWLVRYTATEIDPYWEIELDFDKELTPATEGAVTIYLNDSLVDLSRPVTLTVNGRRVYRGKPELRLDNLVNSCARFFDPARLYPAAIRTTL